MICYVVICYVVLCYDILCYDKPLSEASLLTKLLNLQNSKK